MLRRLATFTSLAVLALAQLAPAHAEAIDPATATCAELSQVNEGATDQAKQRMGVLLLWTAGFLAPESQGNVVDFGQIQADADKIAASCAQTPNLGLKTVASKLWEKKQPTTPKSIDLSTVKCSSLIEKTQETTAAGLIWLIGNAASDEETPMFDMSDVLAKVEKIAAECVQEPKLSLVTAAEKVLEQ